MSKYKQKAGAPLWVSQNFLTSQKTIRRLIRKTSIGANDHVVEIGPGKGHITRVLLEFCGTLSAVEMDKGLHNKLAAKHGGAPNLRLYHQDFLKWNLPKRGDYKVFANIPFNCTSDILTKLTESANPPSEAWLVMEKGAAKRFMGRPRESLRSLLLKPKFDIGIDYYFRREDFHPKPGVDVVLVHLRRKAVWDVSKGQWRDYVDFVRNVCETSTGDILYIQWLCLFRRGLLF